MLIVETSFWSYKLRKDIVLTVFAQYFCSILRQKKITKENLDFSIFLLLVSQLAMKLTVEYIML